MPQIYGQELNLYSMFLEVRSKLGEDTASFWTTLELYNWLNQAQGHIARKTKCLKKTVTVTTIENTATYALRDNGFPDIIDIDEEGCTFLVNGTIYTPMVYKTKAQLNKEFPNWRGASASTPQYFYYDKATKTIGLYPKPNSSNAGAYLFVSGSHMPKVLHAGLCFSSGSTSSLILAVGGSTTPYPSPTADYYNDLYIEIVSGTGAGQKSKITDYAYVGATATCTISVTTAPDTSSYYGMIPEIPQEAHYLMPLFTLWKAFAKGGTRTSLANNYRQEYYTELGNFIGEYLEEDAEELIRDSYR